jgi:hypothetical protein
MALRGLEFHVAAVVAVETKKCLIPSPGLAALAALAALVAF